MGLSLHPRLVIHASLSTPRSQAPLGNAEQKCINIECITGAEQFFVARQPSCRYPYADQDLGSRKPRRWKFCVRDANRFKKQKVIRKLVRKPFSEHGLAHVYARSDRLAGPIFGGAGMRWECRGNAPGTQWERRPKARVLASNGPFCASNARVLEFRQLMRVGHVRSRLPAGDLSQRLGSNSLTHFGKIEHNNEEDQKSDIDRGLA